MAVPPKLYDLAFGVVVNFYTTAIFPTKVIPPNTTVSDQIFETVMRNRKHCYDAHTKRLIKEFKPTKLELDLEDCKHDSFWEIRRLKLTELKLRNFCWIPKYAVIDDDLCLVLKKFFISQFLGDILSAKTKKELRVLDISKGLHFEEGWMEAVSSMFPKLEVLNISKLEISEEDFAVSCNNLPNLHTLHIGDYKIKTLKGISKLKNLKNLVIDDCSFWNKEDVKELFKLKNLTSFTFIGGVDYNYENYFSKPFPKLTHLEIKWERADDDFLRRILPKLPNLQVVVAIDTKIHENVAPPSVTVYTCTDLKATMKSLAHFRTTGDRNGILRAIKKFSEIYRNERIRKFCTPDELTVCVDEVEALLETFEFDRKIVKKVNSCFEVFTCFAMGDGHLNVNKLKIVRFLLKNLKSYLKNCNSWHNWEFGDMWLNVSKLIQNTEHLNVDEIAALAMKSIIRGGGVIYWEEYCAEVLEKILDRMHLSSESYEKINFRKFHECLSRTHKNKILSSESKASVGDVLKYIEVFM